MLESLACHSVEKLVMDAESIASACRLVQGIEIGSSPALNDTLATGMFAKTGLSGEFLKLKETRSLFRQEQYLPSSVVDRSARSSDLPTDMFARARARVNELVSAYREPAIPEETLRKLQSIVERQARPAGLLASH